MKQFIRDGCKYLKSCLATHQISEKRQLRTSKGENKKNS